jgi:putative restriction endonuclease
MDDKFADSRNNDPCHGIALCKNAHWLFDQGLWTISDDYMVIVAAGQFAEQSPDHKGLRDYHGQIHRLKLLKHQGYGRAGFALLRQRIVQAA